MKISVIGAGTMGSGIAQACAMAGLNVTLNDIKEEQLDKGMESIQHSLQRFAKKNKLQDSVEKIIGRIQRFTSLEEAVKDADIIIEAVSENYEIKKQIFISLDEFSKPSAILGSNTSQISITKIAANVKEPGRVVGVHFFNPAPIMTLVEVIRGLETTNETMEKINEFSSIIKKETVTVIKDRNGFITSRLSIAFRLEAMRILEEGIGTVEDIDKACRLGFNHPMGPFELNDFNGLDVSYDAAKLMEEVYGERFRAPQILENMVNGNRLGRKTGKGWYDYN